MCNQDETEEMVSPFLRTPRANASGCVWGPAANVASSGLPFTGDGPAKSA
jgi:hypothetical protein